MQFRPFVYDAMNRQVPVAIEPMTPQDAALTDREPLWQTSWASEYLANEDYEKYAARVGDELIALAAYEQLFLDADKYQAVMRALADRLYKELHDDK